MNYPTTTCETIEIHLDAWMSREISAEAHRVAVLHLVGCARCTASLAARQRVKAALKNALANDAPAPARLRAGVRQRLSAMRLS